MRSGARTAVRRARIRDVTLFGSPEEAEARYRRSYVPGQRLYLIENTDPARPALSGNGLFGDWPAALAPRTIA